MKCLTMFLGALYLLNHYNHLDLPTFCWKKSHILFDCSGFTTTLKTRFNEPPVDKWGAENMLFLSRNWFFKWFFPYDYVLPRKTEDVPLSDQYYV